MGDHGFGDEDFGGVGGGRGRAGLEEARGGVGVLAPGLGDFDADEAGAEGGAGDEGAVGGYGVGLGEGGVVEGEVGADGVC